MNICIYNEYFSIYNEFLYQKLGSYLHLFTDYFMKISPLSWEQMQSFHIYLYIIKPDTRSTDSFVPVDAHFDLHPGVRGYI